MITTGAIGLVLGLLYLVARRNLWPLVIAQGLFNTTAMTMLYLHQSGAGS